MHTQSGSTGILKDFIDQKRDEKDVQTSDPIFRCTTPSTGQRLGEVVVGTLSTGMLRGLAKGLPVCAMKSSATQSNPAHAPCHPSPNSIHTNHTQNNTVNALDNNSYNNF